MRDDRRGFLAAQPGLFAVGFVMRVAAAKKGDAVEYILLEPFQREINHGSDVESNELGNDETAYYDQAKRPARRAIGAVTQGKRDSAPALS